MFTISHGIFTPPGKFIINDSRANFTERISRLQIHATPIHFHHTNSKKRFHNVNTVVCVQNALLYLGGLYMLPFFEDNTLFDLLCLEVNPVIAQKIIDEINNDIANGKIIHSTDTFKPIADIFKIISERLSELEANDSHESRPAINTTNHKAKSVLVERSNFGRKLQDKNKLRKLYEYDDCEILTRKGKGKSQDVANVASLSFEVLEEWKQFLPADKHITPYMLEILTHLMTIKAAGNDWTSSNILYRQMNGGADKKPTREFYDSLYQALSVLACTRIKIDARKEVKAGDNNRDFYQGALLANSIRGREIVTINGSIVDDAIHILEQSPLFEYALAKGQITPIPPGMYDTPSVNSTQENIVIKGYLIRMFADMINPHSPVQPIISYDTLFNYLGVDGSKPTQFRKNKAKIRKTVRGILSDWVDSGFIKGFQELTEDNTPATERVKVAKVILDLFTRKEFYVMHNNENILPSK